MEEIDKIAVKEETETPVESMPKYWLPDGVYDALKWIGLAALPTCAWIYSALAQVWGLPFVTEVPFTLNIIGSGVAVLIGASALSKVNVPKE